MRILVVCGAGASSTFVAHRMRATVAARGLDVEVAAGSEDDLAWRLGAVDRGAIDVVLVGPHLAPRYAKICALAARHGAIARLLPADVFSIRNGDASVDLALHAASRNAKPTPKETQS